MSDEKTKMVGGDWDQPPDILPDEPVDEVEASRAPLLDHLLELRDRLIWSMGALVLAFVPCFLIAGPMYQFLIVPYVDALGNHQATEPTLYFAPFEFLFTKIKLAFLAALVIVAPFLMYQLYRFVAPGLYKNERQAVAPFLIAMPVLFTAGAALVYYMIMPFAMNFAAGMEQAGAQSGGANIELFTKVGEYLTLITTLIMAFGFAFQLPVVLTLLAIAGIVTPEMLTKNRRFAIVGIFLVAAILTPPDPLSQIALGLTIMALYELSVIAVRMAAKRHAEQGEEVAAE